MVVRRLRNIDNITDKMMFVSILRDRNTERNELLSGIFCMYILKLTKDLARILLNAMLIGMNYGSNPRCDKMHGRVL